MIGSFRIRGFKLFRDLTLPRLGRLNLFVGENNTGKSCLLEAIRLYAGRAPLNDVMEAASARVSDRLQPWSIDGLNEESSPIRHPIFDLFHWEGPSVSSPVILEKLGDLSPLKIEFALHERVANEQGAVRYIRVSPGSAVGERVEIALPVYRGNTQVGLVTRRMLPPRVRIPDSERFFNEDAQTVAYLPANGFSEEKAASLWDGVVQGPNQHLVLDWLRILEPSIDDLAYIGEDGFRRSRVAILKLRHEGRIPLRSMGDGLRRLFHIALAVASSYRGILLIDEFENGLHWRVQEQLWRALAEMATGSNVQIFATTHSRDCIEGFTMAARKLETEGAIIYRLERRNGEVSAMELPLLNVDAAMRLHEEVR